MNSLTEKTRKVVQQYRKYWQQGDLNGILSILHPKAEYITFFGAKEVRAKDIANYVKVALPSSQLDYIYHDDLRVDGDVAISTYSFVHTSAITGKESSCRGCDVMTISQGKIIRIHEYSSFSEVGRTEDYSGREKIALDELRISQVVDDVSEYLNQQQPYLNALLSLDDVVDATGYSRNQLSYVFNHVFKLSFYAYINLARVDYFLANVNEHSHIAALSSDSGFNSLTTFYKFFKKKTGLTPKAYIKKELTDKN
ncbi:nuclear transport factor 2 family protein [Dasania marina]|uniref:nuclear transport factor 2 family protein n=1 Tax=Dasania marina TaxID=471499 RepID=UPI00035D626C|nr:nuclear transport factor 2 family protein [Dasania marina]